MREFDLKPFIPLLERYFASLQDAVAAYLFGSYARGRTWVQSDVDVAVLLNGRPGDETCFDRRLEIVGGLMDVLHINDVDVLILNQAPPALRYAVLRDGILLFCRDPQARIMFQVHTLNAYLDFKPILKRHEDALLEKARKGELSRGYNAYQGALEHYRQVRERIAHPEKSDV